MSTLTLIEGSQPELGVTQTILLPEAHTDLKAGDKVFIETDGHVLIGRATIKDVVVKCFSRLTNRYFTNSITPGMNDLFSAYETLRDKVDGFSKCDSVTLISARIDLLAAGEVVI